MDHIVCGFANTTTGTPCRNIVLMDTSACAAGHPLSASTKRNFRRFKKLDALAMDKDRYFDQIALGVVPEPIEATSPGGSVLQLDPSSVPSPEGPLYGLAAFDHDGLVLSDEAVAKVRRKALSPSTANSMSDCGARWSLERLLPRPQDPFGPAELGSSAHHVFEKLYTLPPDQRTQEAAKDLIRGLDHDAEADKLAIPGEEDLNKWRWSVHGLVEHIFDVEDPSKVEVVGNEIPVNTTLGGVPFTGFVDRFARVDGKLTISDFKTGKLPNPRFPNIGYDEQLRLYTLGLRDIGYEPEAAELLYTKFGKRHEVDIEDSLLKGSLVRFQRAWDTLERQTDAKKFDYKPGTLCSWCPAFDSCPATAGKTRHKSSTKPDLSPEDLGIGHVARA